MNDYPDMLSTEHLMEIFSIGKSTTYKMIREGAFGEPFKIPKIYIWNTFLSGNERNIS